MSTLQEYADPDIDHGWGIALGFLVLIALFYMTSLAGLYALGYRNGKQDTGVRKIQALLEKDERLTKVMQQELDYEESITNGCR